MSPKEIGRGGTANCGNGWISFCGSLQASLAKVILKWQRGALAYFHR
jgi:hypothetical protein